MNFKQWFQQEDRKNRKLYNTSIPEDIEIPLGNGWEACKQEIIKILQNTKVPKVAGREGLGGCEWDDMDADKFRDLLVEKIETL